MNKTAKERLEAHALACRKAMAAGLPRPTLADVDLRGEDLRGADLRGADLRQADLRGAYLRQAYLQHASLGGADLRGAYMWRAKLEGANLAGVNLEGADMREADLRVAKLKGAKMAGANLRRANLAGVNGIDHLLPKEQPGLAARVLQQIQEHPETHDQGTWHSPCGTKHCAAGWACVLAGHEGSRAESRLGTSTAAAFLLGGTDHPFSSGDDPIPWLERRAKEKEGPK